MMKKISAALLLTFCLFFVDKVFAVTPNMISHSSKKAEMKVWVDSVFATMSLDEKIGQLFVVTVDPVMKNSYLEKLYGYIQNQKIGGILFTKSTVESQAKVTNILQSKSRVPLFVTLDGEWGLSMRIEGTPRYPKNMALGALSDTRQIYEYGRDVARQCRLMGIQINFAPILDINNNPKNPVISYRSFGENRERVTRAAIAYAQGLESGGVMAVGKHFPGHGDTSIDSHLSLPVLNLSLARLDSLELYPFKKYIEKGFSGMMVGHLYLPVFDTDTIPASLSHNIVSDLLKNELKFEGLIFTDALVMKAIVPEGESPSVKALLAGNDILLSPSNPVSEFNAVKQAVADGEIKVESIEAKCRKVLTYKYLTGLNDYSPIDLNNLTNRLNTRDGEVNIDKLAEESLTLLKNQDSIIPIRNLDRQKIAVVTIGEKNTTFQSVSYYYTNTSSFFVNEATTAEQFRQLADSLKTFSTVILGIYTDKSDYPVKVNQLISNLEGKSDVVLSFFIFPYRMVVYKEAIQKANAVLMAYESTVPPQQNAMQLLFGGVGVNGKLTVTVNGLYRCGAGLSTQKCRLAYGYPESVGVDSRKLSLIDSLIVQAIKAKAIPGCQVLVAKDGVVVYQKGFGYFDYADTHPVTNWDLYDLASLTKVTATLPAVMMMYDQNKFLLRDKLSDFIPALKKTNKSNITVKDALYHQSGLPAFIPFNKMLFDPASYKGDLFSKKKSVKYSVRLEDDLYAQANCKFLKEFVSDKEVASYTVKVSDNFFLNPSFHEKMMEKLISAKLGSKQKYVYSDLNFYLLRMMVEGMAKTSIDTLLNTRLYSKLGAITTGYLPLRKFDKLQIAPTENDRFFRNQLLIGYVHDELAALSGGVEGNAGLFSNANDLAKYCQMLLNGGTYGRDEFIKKETVQMFTQMKSPDSRRALGFDKPNPVKPSKGPTCDSAPLSTYGHTGFTGTCFWIDPENKLIYIFLSNRVYPNSWNNKLSEMDTRTLIQDAIYRAIIQNKK